MKEGAFVKKNIERWEKFESSLKDGKRISPDELADLFIQITDDLAYARTKYPDSESVAYLNNLASKTHQKIYRNRKEETNRFIKFWRYEVPMAVRASHKHILYSLIIFVVSMIIGAVSTANDDTYVRLILGDAYVNMTLENIKNGEPMGVYGSDSQTNMFFYITFNNIRVSFNAFIAGILLPALGAALILFLNGIMVGAFQFFFFQQELFMTSFLTIWIHGTLEISAIVIAGGAGLMIGSSLLFPDTYSRLESFKRGASRGIKVVVGLIPVFITAGFLESFITRLAEMPVIFKVMIIGLSAFFILYYFVIYPIKLSRNEQPEDN